MITLNKRNWILTLGAMIWITSFSAQAQEPAGQAMEQKKAKWEAVISEIHQKLGLNPEQEQKLKEHRDAHRANLEVLRGQLKEKREQIKQALQKDNFNVEEVKRIHGELKVLKAQMEDARLEGILEVRQILTTEQFNKFMELKKDWKNHNQDDSSRNSQPEKE